MPTSGARFTRTLIIDNYDSYTYNLYQLLAEVNGECPLVIKNDEKSIEEIQDMVRSCGIDNIVISPGPGNPKTPQDIGVCEEVFNVFKDIPILGVCLGHQILASVHGSRVVRARDPVHGRLSDIKHNGHSLFWGIPSGKSSGFQVVRYHSLVVDEATLPSHLIPIAWTTGHHHALRSDPSSSPSGKDKKLSIVSDTVLMAVAVADRPHFGVQFHPESVGTTFGIQILQNFCDITKKGHGKHSSPPVRNVVGPPGHRMPPKAFVVNVEGWEGNMEVCYQKCESVLSGRSHEAERLFNRMFGGAEAADTFWLDSAATDRGRFSFMGGIGGSLWQCLTYKLYDKRGRTDSDEYPGELSIRDSNGQVSHWKGNLWDYLKGSVKRNRVKVTMQMLEDLPFNFWGGYVGYLGYELKALCGGNNAHKASTPDACLFLADRIIAIDHKENDVYCLALRRTDDDDVAEVLQWIDQAASQVASILKEEIVNEDNLEEVSVNSKKARQNFSGSSQKGLPNGSLSETGFRLDQPQEQYSSNIQSCLDYLNAGESYEVCLTNQLRRKTDSAVNPTKFYSLLRKLNPAPYAAFLRFGAEDLSICCSSPERFLRGDRGAVLEARPIKGTAARHSDPAKDAAASYKLYTSEKDQAENLMIVDLLRNDLGHVCEAGSVYVKSLMEVESYATVHQLVSTVTGIRRKETSIVSAIHSAFPGGSMTGAPKIRTMELLDGLEVGARGVYSGSIGYIGFNDSFDLNIVIRTAILHGKEMTIGAGGAIVLQSDVQDEYKEMLLKTKALVQAVGVYNSLSE